MKRRNNAPLDGNGAGNIFTDISSSYISSAVVLSRSDMSPGPGARRKVTLTRSRLAPYGSVMISEHNPH